MKRQRAINIEETNKRFLDSGRKYAAYARNHKWPEGSFRDYMRGVNPLRPGSRAYAKYVPQLDADGIVVYA